MIYSFDIFDTCLVRKCGAARNMFDILAQRVFKEPVSIKEQKEFVIARLQAEAETYAPSQTLRDIYDALPMLHHLLKSKEELIRLEEDCEKDMLVPVLAKKKLIESMRKKGNQIVFISDMYLRSSLLKEILIINGLYKDGDLLFVSCEYNATKTKGDLYQVVQKALDLTNFKNWIHYGDNKISDYSTPKRLGICTKFIEHTYTPYEQNMRDCADLNFQWGGILAGLSRSVLLRNTRNAHYDCYIDIVLPLYISFTIRAMKDALKSGISTLYFCARDSYPLYQIAKKLSVLFPNLEIVYLYISRQSLYEGDVDKKIGYFKQIGIATTTKNNAIVDIRSSGKTLLVLNDILSKHGFQQVKGYFFELFPSDARMFSNLGEYYAELNAPYISQMSKPLRKLPSNWYLYELFFPLNTQKRTIGYSFGSDGYSPIFENEDKKEYRLDKLDEYVKWREDVTSTYMDEFIKLGLCIYSDEIFERYAIPQLARFIQMPNKHYLPAFYEFYGEKEDGIFVPYVDKSIWRLPLNILKKRTIWKRGTIVYSLPSCLTTYLFKNRQ